MLHHNKSSVTVSVSEKEFIECLMWLDQHIEAAAQTRGGDQPPKMVLQQAWPVSSDMALWQCTGVTGSGISGVGQSKET